MENSKLEKSVVEQREDSKPKRVFIELGTHAYPVPILGSRKFKEDETYIGIDIDPKKIKQAAEGTKEQKDMSGGSFFFLQADAAGLPIKDKTTDEVFVGNMFGDGSISEATKEKLLQESKRILKDGGVIIINETITPLPSAKMKHFIIKEGLEIIKQVNKNSAEWEKTLVEYDMDYIKNDLANKNSYTLFLKIEEQK